MILITAELTFGWGLKCEAGTRQTRLISAKVWMFKARTESLPGLAIALLATSFWVIRTRSSGRCEVSLRKWFISGEVM